MNEENEIVIIGGDHHNTLSVVRSFGRKKKNFKILIHENDKNVNDLMISHSRFSKKLYIVNNCEKEILEWLVKNQNETKQIIIACSDLAEYTIDHNYNQLDKYYLISGFINNRGKVVKLMDKFNQKKWADDNKIKMAKSWHIDLKKDNLNLDSIEYPCIIKPNISAFGKKSDITICNSKKELVEAIEKFKKIDYSNAIIQKFIKKKYEICALGVIVDSENRYYGGIIKKDRENPPQGGGSLTFAHFINDENINRTVSSVIQMLYDEGYRGLYDIEFLVGEDDIYLNEINFRNSGNNYALQKYGIDAPYIYYLNLAKKEMYNISIKKKSMYFMDELNEIMLWRRKHISIFDFIKDFLKASAYAKLDYKDFGIMLFFLKRKKNK